MVGRSGGRSADALKVAQELRLYPHSGELARQEGAVCRRTRLERKLLLTRTDRARRTSASEK